MHKIVILHERKKYSFLYSVVLVPEQHSLYKSWFLCICAYFIFGWSQIIKSDVAVAGMFHIVVFCAYDTNLFNRIVFISKEHTASVYTYSRSWNLDFPTKNQECQPFHLGVRCILFCSTTISEYSHARQTLDFYAKFKVVFVFRYSSNEAGFNYAGRTPCGPWIDRQTPLPLVDPLQGNISCSVTVTWCGTSSTMYEQGYSQFLTSSTV
jgi:hypothetical protein